MPLSIVSFAAEPVTLSLTNDKVYAGDEFTLNLLISDNSQMSGAVIEVSYDKTKLEFVSAEQGGILNENANVSLKNIDGKKPCVRFTYLDSSSSVTSAGILAKLTFRALDDADGTTSLTISVPNAGDFIRQDLSKISYKVKNSSVEIINTSPAKDETESKVNENDTTSETIPETSEIETTANENVNNTTEESVSANENTENNNESNNTIVTVLVAAIGVIAVGIVVALIVHGNTKKKKGDK